MTTNRTRRALTVFGSRSLTEIQAYMPSNYEAFVNADGRVEIVGQDNAGWTLDGYVIPRLASGLIGCKEVL